MPLSFLHLCQRRANIHTLIALGALLGVGILLFAVVPNTFSINSSIFRITSAPHAPELDFPVNVHFPEDMELSADGNIAVNKGPPTKVEPAANVDILAPTLYPGQKYRWITENQKATHSLFRCMKEDNCAQNQTKVVIIASVNFLIPLEGGYIGGEAIWALSTFQALQNMGYTVMFAISLESSVQLYHMFANLVKVIIANPDQAHACFKQTTCVRSAENPAGIPAWKIFSFHWWESSENELGAKWTLSPENYLMNGRVNTTYLGYSIEPQCSRYPFIPHSQRESQVYILAKFLKFFLPADRAWPPDFFDAAANATGASFVMASMDLPDAPKLSPGDLATSIINVGPVTQDEFYDLLSKSVALVGVGNPALSPTPYDAMCLGVPFINPIGAWDKENPTDRTKWVTQHNMLKHLSPPHVYHVFLGDQAGFVKAIRDAIANPIESYVLERMKMTSVQERLGNILEHDWKTEAAELLKAREAGEAPGPLFML